MQSDPFIMLKNLIYFEICKIQANLSLKSWGWKQYARVIGIFGKLNSYLTFVS